MLKKLKFFIFYLFFVFLNSSFVLAEIVKNIEVKGNERITRQTILMFSDISINEEVNNQKINEILKNLYNSNFFDNVSVSINNNNLLINVKELPIIENISFEGIKAKKIKKEISEDLNLKQRASFNEVILIEDKQIILRKLKNLGYYFPTVETFLEDLNDNRVNLKYKINLGEKAKIKKILFIGDKIYKDKIGRASCRERV